MKQKPSGSLISYMSGKVKSGGGINLAQGLPGFYPPKYLLELLCLKAGQDVHQYAPSSGNKLLLDAIERIYPEKKERSLLITQGATEAVTLTYLYLKKKYGTFHSIAFTPLYESYRYLPEIFSCPFTGFSYDKEIDHELLIKNIKDNHTKLIVINTPGNPYGRIMNPNDFDMILNLSEKYDFYVLVDAVYSEFYFDTPTYLPFEKFNEKVIFTSSFSKLLSVTGWRVGWMSADSKIMRDISYIHDYTDLSASSLLQEALGKYLEETENFYAYIKDIRMKLTENYNIATEMLTSCGFTVLPAGGGYFVWTKVPEDANGFDFAEKLYQEIQVAVVPGIHFDPECTEFIRVNIAREKEELLAAFDKIKNYSHKTLI